MIADDLFAGAGGWDLAAAQLGIHARGAENMKDDRPNVARRSPDHPAPTMAFGHERPRWCWAWPSTTIVGSFRPEIVAAPGYRVDVSRQNAPDSVRVTVHEAGVLQSFPADYSWQGAKGKQFLQCGNAVPPGMALHALAAAAGVERQEAVA